MWAWLAIPWVRKIAEVGLLVAALAAVCFAIYHAGQHSGERSEAGRQTESNRAQFEQIRSTFQEQLVAGQAREQQLAQLATKFAELASAAASRATSAQSAAAADSAKLKALPDSAIKTDLETKAGGALENAVVLRHIDDVVTDYPHKLDELAADREQLAALNSRIDAVLAQAANSAEERDRAIVAFNQLVPLYTQAYNAAIEGHRKWYCLFLCKPKNKISLPAPVALAASIKGAAR